MCVYIFNLYEERNPKPVAVKCVFPSAGPLLGDVYLTDIEQQEGKCAKSASNKQNKTAIIINLGAKNNPPK